MTLVHEFYANWLTETKYKSISVRGENIRFFAHILNEVLGTLHCDAEIFNVLKDKSPYRDIRQLYVGLSQLGGREARRHGGITPFTFLILIRLLGSG